MKKSKPHELPPLARQNAAQRKGAKLVIISWASKEGPDPCSHQHLHGKAQPGLRNICPLSIGMKGTLSLWQEGRVCGVEMTSILFDDEQQNC